MGRLIKTRIALFSAIVVMTAMAASLDPVYSAAAAHRPAAASLNRRGTPSVDLSKMPLAFAQAGGSKSSFLAHSGGSAFALSSGGALSDWTKGAPQPFRLRPGGASPGRARPSGNLPGTVNYMTGNDSGSWRTGVSTYSRVTFRHVYPGIGLRYYGSGSSLEYDFLVGAGASPHTVTLSTNAKRVRTLADGGLEVRTAGGVQRWRAPVAYQISQNGQRRPVRTRFHVLRDGAIGFHVGAYRSRKPLVIDPALSYSTYIGGSVTDVTVGSSVAVDQYGNSYLTGATASANFPHTSGALQTTYSGAEDMFVTKLASDGSSVVWSTFIGGSGEDRARDIVVSATGEVYVSGAAFSTDFPLVNAAQPTIGGLADATVLALSPDGSHLDFSTFLGGSSIDGKPNLTLDNFGNVWVAGFTHSSNFPVLNAFQPKLGGGTDAFITEYSSSGAMLYSSFLGGNGSDSARGIRVTSDGSIYVTGFAYSNNFPVVNAYQATNAGDRDIFMTKLAPGGKTLVYSTYLGGTGQDSPYRGPSLAVDASGRAYVVGWAYSANFPISNPIQSVRQGVRDATVTEFSPSGNSLVFSTYLGGSNDEEGNGITLDPSGNIWVTGYTKSSDFPVVSPIQAAKGGSADAFISELAPAGTSLLFSTFIGGSKDDLGMAITSDSVGNIYATGYTESLNFPTVAPMQPANAGYRDLFALKIGSAPLPTGLAPPTLTDVPANHSSANVSFSFTHPTPGVTFQCGIDGGAPVDCTSPAVYSGLADGPHVFRVTAFGTGGASSPATEYSWDVGIDSTPPTVSITLVADTLGTNTTNTVNYSGTDDHAIDHFDVYSRYGLGGSQTLVQSSPLQKYTATGLAPGTYCYQVTAFDAAGNSATSAERCTDVPFDDRDASISYSGATLQIASAGAYSGTITRLSGAGQSAQVSCVCRKFGFLIQKSPSSGKVKVYIDGHLAATVDLYSVGVLNSQLAVKSTFPLGPHTLQLVWSGTKSASSSGFDVNVDGISTIA